jgi:hypothetical protein
LAASYNQVTWFGKGPQENYSNRREGAQIGEYSGTAESLYTNYLEPQANGNRSLTRWVAISNDSGIGFVSRLVPASESDELHPFLPNISGAKEALRGDWFNFTAIPFSEDELALASLRSQLPESSGVSLHLDVAHSGVSQKPFGPRWDEDELLPENTTFAFVISPLPTAD